MTRLPYQVLVCIRRRPTPDTAEYLVLKRISAHGGFWRGVTGEKGQDVAASLGTP
jgi:hypothetical protein